MSNTLKLGNGKWATGKDTVLAYNDLNNNFKPLPFSFSRASSATVVNKAGLIETVGSGEPRIDFKDDAKGALLLEPSRTNKITYSEDFSSWTKTSSTTSLTSSAISTSSNYTLFETSVLGGNISSAISSTSGIVNFSIYVKKGTAKAIRIRLDAAVDANCWVNLESGTEVGSHSGQSLEINSFNNGFYRISFTANVASLGRIKLYTTEATTTIDEIGNINIYGAQLEVGSYATSYIPTSGSVVTRAADVCSNAVPDGVIGQTEGTMFVDCKINAQGTYTGFSLSDGTTNNEVIVRFTTTDRIEYYLRSGGTQPFGGGTTSFDTDSRVKIAIAYKSGNSVFYVNGTEVASSTSTTIPLNLSKVKFSRGNSSADFSGITNNFKVYNTRLSNSELATLTTI
tara:strand:+ start:171 stop:1364 length:1194 start_codon:yes stop_codon:yes gene_type:complete